MMHKKVLILGANGLIGSWLTGYLQTRNIRLYAVVRSTKKVFSKKVSFLYCKNLNSKKSINNIEILLKKIKPNFVINCLNLAHKLGLDQSVAGIINCPINKKHLKKNNIGVTEYLAKKCAIKDGSEVMIIGNRNLLVSPLTTHIDIKSIPGKIKKKLIKIIIKTIYN